MFVSRFGASTQHTGGFTRRWPARPGGGARDPGGNPRALAQGQGSPQLLVLSPQVSVLSLVKATASSRLSAVLRVKQPFTLELAPAFNRWNPCYVKVICKVLFRVFF